MSNPRTCLISLGINSPSHPDSPNPSFQDFSRGLERIQEDLLLLDFQGDFLFWDTQYPEGCPTHQETHGAYKPFCFHEAQKKGCRFVLWVDASIKIGKSLEPLFKLIEKDGYLIF